jgi:D-sedoheptulose 7-phosphate isomerase
LRSLFLSINYKVKILPAMTPQIKDILEKSITVKQTILSDNTLLKAVESAVEAIVKSLSGDGKILFCGNGGSAADAQHLAAEFSGRFYQDRKALPAEALHCNTSYITAVGNDYGYDVIYSRMIEGIAKPNDVIVGLSTSGNSANIVKAFEAAKAIGCTTIGFTGDTGGKMKALSDILINVPSSDTPRIQESHITLGHIICELAESNLFK